MYAIQVSRLNYCLSARYSCHAFEEHPDSLRRSGAAVPLGNRRIGHYAVRARPAGRRFIAGPKIGILATHKSIGITILGLALLRLAWRCFNPVPPLPPGAPRWQDRAAHVSHFLLYALLFITPLLGWLMSSARAFSVSWFGLVTLPDFIEPNNARLRVAARGARDSWRTASPTIAIVHAAAALKHHFLDRDDVLRRMLPAPDRSHS